MQVFGPTVRFNVQCTPTRHSYDQFRDNWLLCERLGFDVAYSTDHFVSGQPDNSVLEGPTVLSAMFAQTTRMRGGLMVAGNTFRNPGILAKIATTLDHVSHGRFELGMGSGHTEIEHRQYNIPYYTQGTRLRMLGESIQIVRSLLENEKTTFEGKYYQMVDAYCEPKPVQRPLPFLVGGIGEDLTMRVVARSADIWNFWESPSAEVYAQKLVALQRHCDEVGRDPAEIRKSVHIKPVVGETEAEVKERGPTVPRARSFETCEQISERLLDFVRLGLSDFVFMLDEPCDFRTLELLATRVAPYVRTEGARILEDRLGSRTPV